MKRPGSNTERECSFCRKIEEVVGQLISSPNDHPRSYICDECIAVCNSILEDAIDRRPGSPENFPKKLAVAVTTTATGFEEIG